MRSCTKMATMLIDDTLRLPDCLCSYALLLPTCFIVCSLNEASLTYKATETYSWMITMSMKFNVMALSVTVLLHSSKRASEIMLTTLTPASVSVARSSHGMVCQSRPYRVSQFVSISCSHPLACFVFSFCCCLSSFYCLLWSTVLQPTIGLPCGCAALC